MDSPKLGLKNLLKSKWTAANTAGVTPSIGTGWYDYKSTTPVVTITGDDEVAQSTGATGYFGLATGGVPAQYWVGSIEVNCWATREDGATNPKQLCHLMKEEIKRIIRANYDQISDIDWIVWRGGFERVEADKTPAVFRYAGETGYGYLS